MRQKVQRRIWSENSVENGEWLVTSREKRRTLSPSWRIGSTPQDIIRSFLPSTAPRILVNPPNLCSCRIRHRWNHFQKGVLQRVPGSQNCKFRNPPLFPAGLWHRGDSAHWTNMDNTVVLTTSVQRVCSESSPAHHFPVGQHLFHLLCAGQRSGGLGERQREKQFLSCLVKNSFGASARRRPEERQVSVSQSSF